MGGGGFERFCGRILREQSNYYQAGKNLEERTGLREGLGALQ